MVVQEGAERDGTNPPKKLTQGDLYDGAFAYATVVCDAAKLVGYVAGNVHGEALRIARSADVGRKTVAPECTSGSQVPDTSIRPLAAFMVDYSFPWAARAQHLRSIWRPQGAFLVRPARLFELSD